MRKGEENSLDDTGCLRSLETASDSPRADFVRPTGEVPDQLNRIAQQPVLKEKKTRKAYIKTRVPRLGDLPKCARRADLRLLFLLLLIGLHQRKPLLERDGERDEWVAWVVCVDPALDLWEPLVLLADVVPFREVHEVSDGLGGEQLETVDYVDLNRGGGQ